MAKNSVEAYSAAGKTNLLMFDPDTLSIVTDEASPLYDKRHALPVSESLVLNIMHHGVLQPIIVNKNTETGAVEVVAGRQRVKAAREANARLRAQGSESVMVPGVVRRAEGADLAGVMVSENEIREGDTPLGRAEKMRRLMSFGKTEADLAVLFGISTQTVKTTLALLECTAAVRKAVEAGQIGVVHARALSKLSPEDQRERVAELVLVAEASTGHEKARKQRAVATPEAVKLKTRREITAERDAATGERRAALDWVLGETSPAVRLVA